MCCVFYLLLENKWEQFKLNLNYPKYIIHQYPNKDIGSVTSNKTMN